jgi:dephospho-CoA kinase
VMKRSRLSEGDVRAIIATQMPAADRIARADDVIDNSGAPELLDAPVARLHHRYLDAATAFRQVDSDD